MRRRGSQPLIVVVLLLAGSCQMLPVYGTEPSDEDQPRAPRVLPLGKLPQDTRLGPLRGERGDFSFTPATSPDDWEKRAKQVRHQMLVAMGLWPMPTKTPLNAVVYGKRDLDDYSVEKVFFESLPGFYVTGNLYRPKGEAKGKRPAVLSPHGHFPGGRFIDEGADAVKTKIAAGAEKFEDGGRSFMQSRCVELARMGCVVFHYDMIGYGDSVQIPLEVAHRFSGLRAKFKKPRTYGFYSAAAELSLFNPLGLHTWNSIRALDFLISLPDVDADRIAVTGGSGGGTQTFMLCAVDDRPLVSVPVVIVSTTRQGGCTCENISGLRLGTNNLEFTALHAPKPLLLISADDATRTMHERGFPELRQHYRQLRAEDNVEHVSLLQFPHNYNIVSRTAMYHFLNKHLKLGLEEPIVERPYRRLSEQELTVWDGEHPRPGVDVHVEVRLRGRLESDARRQMQLPDDRESLQHFRDVVGRGWQTILRGLPQDPKVTLEVTQTSKHETHEERLGLLRYHTIENHRAELPLVQLVPKKPVDQAVIWISGAGKSRLYDKDGALDADVVKLLDAGRTVIGVDLLYQGEFLDDGRPIKRQRSLPGEEGYAGWTYCYNLPVFARRVHDILAVLAFAKTDMTHVSLVGLDNAGPLAAAAVSQSSGELYRAAISTGDFRFADVRDIYDMNFLPGAAKYLDMLGLMMLCAPTPLWMSGEEKITDSVLAAHTTYAAAKKPNELTIWLGKGSTSEAAVKWLLTD